MPINLSADKWFIQANVDASLAEGLPDVPFLTI